MDERKMPRKVNPSTKPQKRCIQCGKATKRITAVLLAVIMVVTLYSPGAFVTEVEAGTNDPINAAAKATLNNPRIVKDPTMKAKQKVTWDCVWFGSYPQSEVTSADGAIYNTLKNTSGWNANNDVTISGTKYRRMKMSDATYGNMGNDGTNHYKWSDSTTYHYFKYEPIKWRVLNINGSEALLLADVALDDQEYNTSFASVTWETSTMRSWLNGYGASVNTEGTDYAGKNFIGTAFSAEEKNAIKTATVENEDNWYYGTEGGNSTSDKIFLLSEAEAYGDKAVSYGFVKDNKIDEDGDKHNAHTYDEARRSHCSTYAFAMGTYRRSTWEGYKDNCWWWLRSPGDDTGSAAYVNNYGYVYEYGDYVDFYDDAVRPALKLNLSSSNLYSYAGTVCSDAMKSLGGGGGGSVQVSTPTPSVAAGTYNSAINVSLSCTTAGADIYYTLDGSTPSSGNGSCYTGTIKISSSMTLKAIAISGGETSGVMTAYYKIEAGSSTSEAVPDVQLTKSMSGESTDQNLLKFFPGNMSVGTTKAPVSASKTVEADGSYKLKVSIGIGKSDWLDKESNWSEYKQTVEKAKSASNQALALSKIRKMALSEGKKKTISIADIGSFKKKPEVEVTGYIEIKADRNNNIMSSEGGMIVTGTWKDSSSKQFITGIGPVYINLTGKVEIKGTGTPHYVIKTKQFSMSFGLSMEPSITLEGGYGIDKVATIGAKGKAAFPTTIVPFDDASMKLKATASIHIYCFALIDYDYTLAQYNTTLWSASKAAAKSSDQKSAGQSAVQDKVIDENVSLIDSAYEKKTTKWMSSVIEEETKTTGTDKKNNDGKAILKDTGTKTDVEVTLQKWGLITSKPQIARLGDKTVMVYQTTDTTETGNRFDTTKLMYSVYRNGSWSTPEIVWDNGTADLEASMLTVGDKIYLAWGKEKAKLTSSEEDIEKASQEMTQGSEIATAVFDSGTDTFHVNGYLTENTQMDMAPQIINANGSPLLIWRGNSENDYSQKTGDNLIYSSSLVNGDWTDRVIKERTNLVIHSMAGIDENGKLVLGYSAQDSTVEDAVAEVYIKNEGQNTSKISDGNASALNVQTTGDQLYYWQDGSLKLYDITAHTLESVTLETSAFSNNAVIYSNGEKTAVLWSETGNNEESGTIYSSILTEGKCSEPVALYTVDKRKIQSLSALLLSDNSWQFITNQWKDVDGQIESDLVYATSNPTPKIVLEDVFVYEDKKDTDDMITPVDYMVVNNSEVPVTSVNIKVDGEVKEVPCDLAPGEGTYLSGDLDSSGYTTESTASVSVNAVGQMDVAENTKEITVGLSNTSLEVSQAETIDELSFVATVTNHSDIATSGTVTVYDSPQKEKVMGYADYDTLEEEESTNLTLTIEKAALTYNSEGAVYLYVEDKPAAGDCNEMDNTDTKATYKEFKVSNLTDLVAKKQKTVYQIGEQLNLDDITVTAEYDDDTLQVVNGYTTNADTIKMTVAGEKNLVITYTEEGITKQCSIKIYVKGVSAPSTTVKPPVVQPAVTAFTKGAITYKVTGKNQVQAAGTVSKKAKSLTIPSAVVYGTTTYSIVSIKANAFKNCKKLKKITIKSTKIKTVGKNALKGTAKNLVIKVPKSKKKAYTKLFKGKGNKTIKMK